MRIFKIINGISIWIILIVVAIWSPAAAKQTQDEKCYKVNKQSSSFMPGGLEVDSQGNIYIVLGNRINAFDSKGNFQYALKVPTYGAFQINVDSNDILNVALARENKVLQYDKDGHIVQEKEDKDNTLYHEFEKNYRNAVDSKGDKYVLTNFFGLTKVVRTASDGTDYELYHITPLCWTLKLWIPIILLVPVCLIIIAIYYTNINPSEGKK